MNERKRIDNGTKPISLRTRSDSGSAHHDRYCLSDEAQKIVGTFIPENANKMNQNAIRAFDGFVIYVEYK